MDTKDFIKHPIDHLEINFDVHTNRNITQFDIPGFPQFQTLLNEEKHIKLRVRKPKAYLAENLVFNFQVDDQILDVDLYSINNDATDGHFTLFIRPENQAFSTDVFTKSIVFLLGNSSAMVGYKLEQSKAAISQSLDMLSENDYFNIILFNSQISKWQTNLISATSNNINSAKDFLTGVSGQYGSRLDYGIQASMQQFANNDNSNSILVFTDGRSPLDPRQISGNNAYQTGIFCIGIGDNVDRQKLEMTSALNYGFVTYFNEDDNLKDGMVEVFDKISQPILKSTQLYFDKEDISQVIPQKYPTTFAGSFFYVAGRYRNPGSTQLTLSGDGTKGATQYNWQVDFSEENAGNKLPESLWAKEMIDGYEQEIEVYGETQALKDSAITLSLKYGIRCRYTAYIADYETEYTRIKEDKDRENLIVPVSFIMGNYPNPFNPTTTIRLFINSSSLGMVKLMKIYNILGQLVAVIDISDLSQGYHNIVFNGRDLYGNLLPSGVYFVSLQIQNQVVSTLKINLVK